MTRQEVFNKVVTHLRRQGRQALSQEGDCVYRAPNGDRCAAGCLIADEHYDSAIENNHVKNPRVWAVLAASGVPNDASDLVWRLQLTHDEHPVCAWESCFEGIAKAFNLDVPSP